MEAAATEAGGIVGPARCAAPDLKPRNDLLVNLAMKEVLFLVHRLPFPPDKGDKIRSYYMLRHFASRYKVHLGCFIDDEHDEQYRSEVESMCASSKICRLKPLHARLRSTKALLNGQPMSWPYYQDEDLQAWVDGALRERPISSVVCFSSPMSQYAMNRSFNGRRIMDFVDIDSDKWRQYAKKKHVPMRWIYAREARYLLQFERQVAREFDASVFVTPNEVQLFNELAPDSRGKHYAVANGVAVDFFDPALGFPRPFSDEAKAIVFTGMMNYWANVDGVSWFAEQVFPTIRDLDSSVEFWIVGASPTGDVQALETIEGVKVTGRVPDIRPYLEHASVAVAPLKIARGIQNKVLEALAMDCPVICTSRAASGLKKVAKMPIAIADDANEFVVAVMRSLNSEVDKMKKGDNRQYVLNHYSWNRNLEEFEKIHWSLG